MSVPEQEVVVGDVLAEGKTKKIITVKNQPGFVLIHSKDRITAGDGARAHDMVGKAAISNATNGGIYDMLNNAGLRTHYIRNHSDTDFIARHCAMIPLECVTRRIAAGSFLKRNPGVQEGYRFNPPKLEFFFKDDANHDPQWSEEQILANGLTIGGLKIGQYELDILSKTTVAVFEIIERAWQTQDCTLVDMKIEFGVDLETGEILLADTIDADSWRLWPSGDRRLMKDKQVYRELTEVTAEALDTVKRNFAWIAERVPLLQSKPVGRVAVLLGSASDAEFGNKIRSKLKEFNIDCELRVTSAHKGPDTTLKIIAEYEGDSRPTIIVAVAGRSNGLGPTVSGNTILPVISCPPIGADWGAQDVWSSLRLPSGLGSSTIISPEGAALNAASIFALTDHNVWMKLRALHVNTWVDLRKADKKITAK